MNNDQHNNPMDADELFKKLDHPDHGDHESMDEFEKEALEGFAMLDDPAAAREVYENVLSGISKKTAEQSTPSRSKGIIWFSAAAGLVIVIGLVSLWFNSAKQDEQKNIALNDATVPPAEAPVVTENKPEPETEAEPGKNFASSGPVTNTANDDLSKVKQDLIPAEEKKVVDEEQSKYPFRATTTNEKDQAYKESVAATDRLVEQQAAEYKKEEDKVAAVTTKAGENSSVAYNGEAAAGAKQVPVTTTGTAISQEEAVTLAKKKSGKDKSRKYSKDEAKGGIASETENRSNQPVVNATGGYYSGPVSDQSNQKTLESRSDNKNTNTTTPALGEGSYDMDDGRTRNKLDSVSTLSKPHFDGGDKAVKEYLLKKVSEKDKNLILKGSYRIVFTVFADGSLKVNKIVNTTGNCSACISALEGAMNSMKGWQPAEINGQHKTSELTLLFTF